MPSSQPPPGPPEGRAPAADRPPRESRDLHARVLAEFHEAFGKPRHHVGHVTSWLLKRTCCRLDIHVRVVCEGRGPEVWVFDPHEPAGCAVAIRVKGMTDIAALIVDLRERMNDDCSRRD